MGNQQKVRSLRQFASELRGAIGWLRSLKIDPGSTRFGKHDALCRRIVGADEESALAEQLARANDPDMVACIQDGQELIWIRRHLQYESTDQLLPRLERFVAGRALGKDGSPEAAGDAQNDGYELVFAADLRTVGFAVEFEADGGLTLPGVSELHFECRRPQSLAGLEPALASADHRLSTRAERAAGRSVVGLTALALGKLVPCGTDIAAAATRREGEQGLDDATMEFIREHHERWDRLDLEATHCIMLTLCTPIHVRNVHTWLRGQWYVFYAIQQNLTRELRKRVRGFEGVMRSLERTIG